MKIAVISDIHSNLEGLVAVLKHLAQEKPDELHCLGDIVGYGANPRECLHTVQALYGVEGVEPPAQTAGLVAELSPAQGVVLAGNHDWAVSGKLDSDWFNYSARRAAMWTAEQLSGEELDYLSNLPLIHRQGDIYLVHSSPIRPEDFPYIMTYYGAREAVEVAQGRMLFVGHSHIVAIFLFGAPALGREHTQTPLHIPLSAQAVVNVGSVGQPRDGDPRSAYATYDTDSGELTVHRVEYDINRAAEKIRRAGLPVKLAERLFLGF